MLCTLTASIVRRCLCPVPKEEDAAEFRWVCFDADNRLWYAETIWICITEKKPKKKQQFGRDYHG